MGARPFRLLLSVVIFYSFCSLPASGQQASYASINSTVFGSPSPGESIRQQPSLKEVLDEISRIYKVSFIYNPKSVEHKYVEIKIRYTGPLEALLNTVLAPHQLQFEQLRAGFYSIFPKQEPLAFSDEKGAKPLWVAPQKRTIAGEVKNERAEPLSGVSVLVRGAATGTTTDEKGEFSLTLPNDKQTALVFSIVGYEPRTISLQNETRLRVLLEQKVTGLHDLIVVGYAVQKRASLTGAVATLDSGSFKSRVVHNPLSAMQGAVPGLILTRSAARPGRENWTAQVRGLSSTNSTPPLILVDGVPYADNNDLNAFNAADIESISFLKDASAAIYGSRAANGVILITTKKGRGAQPVVQYNGNYALKVMGLVRRWTNPAQWYEMYNEAQVNNNNPNHNLKMFESYYLGFDHSDVPKYVPAGTVPNTTLIRHDLTFFDVDWNDVLYGNAFTQIQNISISGKSNQTGYYASFGYTGEGSPLRWGENYSRKYNARINTDFQLLPRLKLSNQLFIERLSIVEPSTFDAINGVLRDQAQAGFACTTIDGKPYGWGGNWYSPVWLAEKGGVKKELNTRLNTNFGLNLKITQDLNLIGQAALRYHFNDILQRINHIDFYSYDGQQVQSTFGNGEDFNSLRRQNDRINYQNYYLSLDYKKVFAKDHHFALQTGFSSEKYHFDNFFVKVNNVPDGIYSVSQGTPVPNPNNAKGGLITEWALQSFFSRVTYHYKNKYLLEGTGRYDGSSRFTAANNHRWKFFPAASAGWVVSNEAFLQKSELINYLKMRVSTGSVGNQAGIGDYDYIQLVNTTAGLYPFGIPAAGIRPSTVGPIVAPDRTWERIQTSNLGVDFALFSDRLSGTFDYYWKRNQNMLIAVSFPALLGANAPLTNHGRLQTKGWDASVTWKDRLGAVHCSITGMLSDNKNKLMDLGGRTTKTLGLNPSVQGFPVNSYFGYIADGMIQNEAELAAYRRYFVNGVTVDWTKVHVGDLRFKDINGDHRLDVNNDIVYLGNATPHYLYSLQFKAGWKGLDVSVFVQGVGRRDLLRTDNTWRPMASSYLNQNAYNYGKTWRPDRTGAPLPRITADATTNDYNYTSSSFAIRNNDYMRLKNVVIGYQLPKALIQKAGLSNLRFYFSGENLWEVAGIKDGWDPETLDNPDQFPFYRYLAFGIDVTL